MISPQSQAPAKMYLSSRSYTMKKNKGKERSYTVNNDDYLSTEQAQRIVDVLTESAFKQLFKNS